MGKLLRYAAVASGVEKDVPLFFPAAFSFSTLSNLFSEIEFPFQQPVADCEGLGPDQKSLYLFT
jgi:hypothetical protein